MRNKKIQIIAEVALSVALAAVLGLLKLVLPISINGGSISLAMLPIIVIALRRGPWVGAVSGALYGMVDLVFEPYILFWTQVLLDYPLPFLALGLIVGLFARVYRSKADAGSPSANAIIVAATVAGCAGRYTMHVLSGAIFFAEYADGLNPWVYSLVYNISYVAPSMVICLLLALMIVPALDKAVPAEPKKTAVAIPETDASVVTEAGTRSSDITRKPSNTAI